MLCTVHCILNFVVVAHRLPLSHTCLCLVISCENDTQHESSLINWWAKKSISLATTRRNVLDCALYKSRKNLSSRRQDCQLIRPKADSVMLTAKLIADWLAISFHNHYVKRRLDPTSKACAGFFNMAISEKYPVLNHENRRMCVDN